MDTSGNTDDFHVFRMALEAHDFGGKASYWRDGVLIGSDLIGLEQLTEMLLMFGDTTGLGMNGSVSADYVRIDTTGAYAPIFNPGDANQDGMVNEADVAILAENWLSRPNATWLMGDFNDDGYVNDIDATMLAVNWQMGVPGSSLVPEPSALIGLLCIGTALLTAKRRKQRKGTHYRLSQLVPRFTLFVAVILAAIVPARAENPPPFVPGSWTLVVLPDTQRYTDPATEPKLEIFKSITRWIADNKQTRNIQFVLHEGDITGGNTAATWQVASDAMAILDKAGVSYSMTTGNHDHDQWVPSFRHSPGRDTLLNNYFPDSRYQRMPTFGGTFVRGRTENNYHLFTAGGKDYITVALEWGPRDETVAWADGILKKYSNRTALIVTHAYTYSDGTRYDWAAKKTAQKYNPHCRSYAFSSPHDGSENVNDGEQLWRKLVSKNKNVSMVFSGHVAWAGARQTAVGDHGKVVHEMLAAYHDPPQGYIRLVEFLPDQKTVRVKTYSPHLGKYMTDDAQQFTLRVDGGGVEAENGRQVFGNNDILINELGKAVDGKLLQKNPTQTNLWKAIPYESEEFAGVMLGGGGGPKQRPITIRLGAKGTCRIFLGLYGGYNARNMRVTLSSDPSSTVVPIKVAGNRTLAISEVFWKETDLTDEDLIIEQMGDPDYPPGALAYVRLEAIPKRKDFYPMTITNDGNGVFFGAKHSSPRDILKSLEKIPDGTCMRTLLWGNGCADNCNYPTKVGQFYPNAGQHHLWQPSFSRNLGIWKEKQNEKGWNSMEVVRDYTRKRKWEFQVYIRMGAFKAPFPFDHQENSKFFNEHPRCHCLDREGQRVNRLSYAYPEVQNYMLRLIKEIVDYNPDGVCLCFIRGVPLVLYEPIMVEGFRKQYGIDPRELDELDPRWMDYQGDVITSFVKRVKKTLKPNQRLSVIVPATELDCKRWGLDVATWVKEGVIDDLLPTGQRFDENDIHRDGPDNLDFKYFARLPGRENIRLMPMLYPWQKYNSDFAGWEQLMRSFLDQGADAYGIWDGGGFKVQNIGKTMSGYKRPKPPASREIKLKSLQGFRIDRYHYFEVI
jgi:hypothetical protein